MKSYTDIPQGEKLVKILPHKSADMYYREWKRMTKYIHIAHVGSAGENDLPCWSLAALIEILPDKVVVDGHRWSLSLGKKSISYIGHMTYDGQLHISVESDNLLDACVNMIIQLKERKLI